MEKGRPVSFFPRLLNMFRGDRDVTRYFRDYANREISAFSTTDEIEALPASQTLRALVESLWYVYGAGVEGDIVEFGTMSGLTASRMAKTMSVLERKMPKGRRLHLFDSFEGLPEPAAEPDRTSVHVLSGDWRAGSCKVLSEDQLHQLCAKQYDPARLCIYPGWFSDTVPTIPSDTKLAMLHVDCDLYQSTMDALAPCFERGLISEGAVVHFDDWNCNRASQKHGERRAWREISERFNIIASDCGSYSWHGQKFIVHSYVATPAAEAN